jgi:endonuclease YncB( thermonuclease family)
MGVLVLLGVALWASGQVRPADEPPPRQWDCIRVIDGDTLVLASGPLVETVRLRGIDCPERNQPYGDQAATELALLVAHERLALNGPFERDRWGRLIADVVTTNFWDPESAVRHMLTEGLAWVYTKYNRDQALPPLERAARKQKRGLWGDPVRPIEPWRWRRGARVPGADPPPAPPASH